MGEYKVTVQIEGYEVYYVEAESEEEALAKWDMQQPDITEVTDAWLNEIEFVGCLDEEDDEEDDEDEYADDDR